MTARVLVVDDVAANTELLATRLSAEYFEVLTATNGPQALAICAESRCDIVLLDLMMPGMDGLEVCRRLKADPATAHIPLVIVTALDQPGDRIAGLEAGADDFLTKPVDSIALMTRVRSLARLKTLTDELMIRSRATRDVGFDEARDEPMPDGENGRILLVEDRASAAERMVRALSRHHAIDVQDGNPQQALFVAVEGGYDMAIVSLGLSEIDGLRLCSQLRSLERTRHMPILVVVDPDHEDRLLRALDLGVNDYLLRPVDRNEMLARVRTQIRRKRFADRLRDDVQASMAMAVTDSLTGLHNRHYLERQLSGLVQNAIARDEPLSLLVLDIDHFKAVNDSHGHQAGDLVLREFSRRVREAVRGIDLCCRLGGEEFVVAMPGSDASTALAVGERIRAIIAGAPFGVGETVNLEVTVSIGVDTLRSADDSPEALLKRADKALYRAKRGGRNQVAAAAA